MIEGSGSGSIPLTNGSGSGSRRPKNMRIRWITATLLPGYSCEVNERDGLITSVIVAMMIT